MKTFAVRLPESLVAAIDAEARARKISKSHVVREWLRCAAVPAGRQPPSLAAIADLIGSVDNLPSDLGARKKHHLRATGYGKNRAR